MASLQQAQEILANAYMVATKISGVANFHPGGSAWVWDGTDPQPGGSWHHFSTRWPVDPNAALYLDPVKVDKARHEVEIMMNAFPATERRLEDLGCEHVPLVHQEIVSSADALMWACSVFNACTPLPDSWQHGSGSQAPGIRDWPWHVFATAQLVPDGFYPVQADNEGRVAVLPVPERCSVIYWAEPGSRDEEEAKGAASKGMDRVLGPRHPVSLAAYHGKWTSSRVTEEETRV